MVDQYYNVNGKKTAYTDLPDYIKRNIAKVEAMPKTASGYPVAAYESVAKERSPARAELAERERLYQQGYKNLPTLTLAYGGGNIRPDFAKERGASKYERYRQAAKKTFGPEAITVGQYGATWDERFPTQYTVVTPDNKVRTFDTKESADKFASRYGVPVQEPVANPLIGPPAPVYEYTTTKGELKTFKTEKEANEFAQKDQGEFVGPYGSLVFTYGQKPLSSTGERLELISGWLESQQKQAAQQGVVGVPATFGYEIAKDFVALGGTAENIFWQAEAFARGGQVKTKEVKVPETATGIITTGIIDRKPVKKIFGELATYEKTYGRGTTVAGLTGLLIPLPVGKVNVVKPLLSTAKTITKPAAKILAPVAEKIRVPKIKNVLAQSSEAIQVRKDIRFIKKEIAEPRVAEGIYKIEKVGKNEFGQRVYRIDRGVEEVAKVKSARVTPSIVGFVKGATKTLIPIYSKIPKKGKLIIPKSGKVAQVPITIVTIGRKTTPKTPTKKPGFRETLRKEFTISRPKFKNALGIATKQRKQTSDVSAFNRSVRRSLKIQRGEKRKVPVEITDITLPEKLPPIEKTKEIVLSSPDIEIARTSKTLGFKQVTGRTFKKEKPTTKTLVEFEQLEKSGVVRPVAIGYTTTLKTLKKSVEKGVVPKSKVTRFYETSGSGLGKGKGFIERTKQKEYVSVGSKDMDSIIQRINPTERKLKSFKKFEPSVEKSLTGAAGGSARAVSLTKTQEQDVISSFAKQISDEELAKTSGLTRAEKKQYYKNIASERRKELDRLYPSARGRVEQRKNKTTDYLSVQDNFVSTREKTSSEDIEVEEEILKFPTRSEQRISGTLRSKVATRRESRQASKLQTQQRSVLDTSLKSKQALKQKEISLLKMKVLPSLEIKTRTIVTPRIRTRVTPRIETRIRTKITPEIRTDLKIKLETPPPKPPRTRKFVGGPPPGILESKRRIRKEKKKPTNQADFLGSASESSIVGLTGREDITYGRIKTARLTALDLRKRKRVSSVENPERIKIRTRRTRKPEWNKTVQKETKQNLFGKKRKVKFF